MNNLTLNTSTPRSPTAEKFSHSHLTATSPVANYSNSDVITVWALNIFKASSGCSSENIADLRTNAYWIPVDLTKTSPRTTRKIQEIQNTCAESPIDTNKIHELARKTLPTPLDHTKDSPFETINRRRSLS